MGLLAPGEPGPVIAERAGARAPFVLICDHAGREVPARLARLGLPQAAFDRHIAWDIGAAGVTRHLSARLNASAILQRYSRLVVDCNRDPTAPDAIPAVADGIVIPGNQGLDDDARRARIDEIHAPYHSAISSALDHCRDQGMPILPVFLHSFTPQMNGVRRPWSFGVLREPNSQFSQVVLKHLRALDGMLTGDNEPYAMDGTDYSAPVHALGRGLDYLELEIRQDLIADGSGQSMVAELLYGVLTEAATKF